MEQEFHATPAKPNCRYGHGELEVIALEDGPVEFTAVPHKILTVAGGKSPFPGHFLFHLYRCASCSYLEMRDLEQATLTVDPYSIPGDEIVGMSS